LGDRQANISLALERLRESDGVSAVVSSSLISTKALAPGEQPDYLNGVAKIETDIEPEELLGCLMSIEADLGRERVERYAARTIDLDILMYDERIIESADLIVPHCQMHLRSFVMEPMAELASELVHPVIGRTMAELLGRLNGGDYMIDAKGPQLISVAGMIGVGKTTLAGGLGKAFGCSMVCEAYDTNPYIAEAYAGNADVALDCQLYFLNSRVEQIGPENLETGRVVVSDYVFEKDEIFARRTLTPEQFGEYKKHYEVALDSVVRPAVVIYLKDRPGNALERIHNRNRSYEQEIQIDELASLAGEYDKLFGGYCKCPVITLDAAKFNCMDQMQVSEIAKELGSYIWT
jgi:2-amino-4-hydroxy-6-hydroxymethyldihydropteridine diphosphokinase